MSSRPPSTCLLRPDELGPPFVASEVASACRASPRSDELTGKGDGCTRQPSLYVRGTLPRLPGIAVVGTRSATPEALCFTRQLVADLGRAGFAIYSGGARGIDHAAHTEALRSGAPTVVVMPCGLDVAYPPEHATLYERVATSEGALVSLWPDGAAPLRFRFLQRNRLLAALCVGLVVVQAPVRSGARSAAGAARKLERAVWAVPHAPWDERGAGCSAELRRGARVAIRALDIIDDLGGPLGARVPGAAASPSASPRRAGRGLAVHAEPFVLTPCTVPPIDPQVAPPSGPAPLAGPRTEEESIIIQLLDGTPRHQDELCARSRLPFARVSAALLTLTLRAVVVEGPAAHYRLAGA